MPLSSATCFIWVSEMLSNCSRLSKRAPRSLGQASPMASRSSVFPDASVMMTLANSSTTFSTRSRWRVAEGVGVSDVVGAATCGVDAGSGFAVPGKCGGGNGDGTYWPLIASPAATDPAYAPTLIGALTMPLTPALMNASLIVLPVEGEVEITPALTSLSASKSRWVTSATLILGGSTGFTETTPPLVGV